jgi:S-DNA-T family DNA segregation ATPase FtsK/SpoIIIE
MPAQNSNRSRSSAASSKRSAAPRKAAPRRTGQRKAASPRKSVQSRQPLFSPQQQREVFACLLIGLGVLLLVLLWSAERGVVGTGLMDLIAVAFGNGVVVLPLLLIVVGGLIFWQERFVDAPVGAGNIIGVLLLAMVLLGTVDFGVARTAFDWPHSIGGVVSYGLMQAFGVAGAMVLLALTALLAIMLTFNVTLRQIFIQIQQGMQAFWDVLWGPKVEASYEEDDLELEPVPYAEELKQKRPRPLLNGGIATKAAVQEPAPEQAQQRPIILTPIAERPTQPGLFERFDGRGQTAAPQAAPEAKQPAKPENGGTSQATTTKKPLEAKKSPADDVADIEVTGTRQAWPLPTISLLDAWSESEVDDNEKRVKARIIEHTLESFKIEAQVVGMNPGPAVTQYQLQPAVGVKVSRITGLEKDLALALSAPSIRIEAPIPGTPYIGIEIPNSAIASVSMSEVLDTNEFRSHKGHLRVALGKDVSGAPVITDLTRAPHLLIAGSTGSGKSVAVNSIICTLLMQSSPDDLKFIMVDPKMVELVVYNNIPHLLAPVVTELERVVSLLKWAVREMERRYKLLAQKGFRNIDSYNKVAKRDTAGLEPLPFIVIIIDELADLMMLAPDEVETLICRLAQMARAIGIHLILATQRPSVDVVTGLIKANFPTRMAFGVTSQVDSRVILDTAGAEQLLGRGDMLYLASDAAKPIRVQGTYVSDREIEEITRFWRAAQKAVGEEQAQERKPALPLKPTSPEKGDTSDKGDGATPLTETVGVSPLPSTHSGQLSLEEQDELLPKAIQLVRQHERASASLLQRRMRIGYSKAAQLLELLEQNGVVGPPEDGRSREVLKENDGEL